MWIASTPCFIQSSRIGGEFDLQCDRKPFEEPVIPKVNAPPPLFMLTEYSCPVNFAHIQTGLIVLKRLILLGQFCQAPEGSTFIREISSSSGPNTLPSFSFPVQAQEFDPNVFVEMRQMPEINGVLACLEMR